MMRIRLARIAVKSVIANTIVRNNATLLRTSSVAFVVMLVIWPGTVQIDNVVPIGVMMVLVASEGVLHLVKLLDKVMMSTVNMSNSCKSFPAPHLWAMAMLNSALKLAPVGMKRAEIHTAVAADMKPMVTVTSNHGNVDLPELLLHGRTVIVTIVIVIMITLEIQDLDLLPHGQGEGERVGQATTITGMVSSNLVVTEAVPLLLVPVELRHGINKRLLSRRHPWDNKVMQVMELFQERQLMGTRIRRSLLSKALAPHQVSALAYLLDLELHPG
jgi:hypothetical protein